MWQRQRKQMWADHKARAVKIVRRGMIPLWLIGALVLLIPAHARAEGGSLPDTFMLRIGGYSVQNAETVLRLDSSNYPIGTYVDFSDTLNGETSKTMLRMDALYRFNKRHSIGLSWYGFKLTGSTVLGQDIQWGDTVITTGSQVNTELKFDISKLNYQYSMFHTDEAEIALLVGFHVMRTSAGINSAGFVNESTGVAVTAPLPVLGLSASCNFTPRFSFYFNYQAFAVDYNDVVRGGIGDTLIGLEYRLFKYVALGAAYNRFNLNVKIKDDPKTLKVESSWNGFMLYGSLYL